MLFYRLVGRPGAYNMAFGGRQEEVDTYIFYLYCKFIKKTLIDAVLRNVYNIFKLRKINEDRNHQKQTDVSFNGNVGAEIECSLLSAVKTLT